jgi:hypothetical protein
MHSLLVQKPLMVGSLLVFIGSMPIKESLAMIGLLAVVSGALI